MKKTINIALLLCAFLLALSMGCEPDEPYPPPNISYGEMTDTRDGQTYKTIQIGSQVWMAENLNYIPNQGNSWCYNDDPENCKIYGRLYDWHTVNSGTGICPAGWQVPAYNHWDTLIENLGGRNVAGGKMKQTGVTPDGLWEWPNTGATNQSGFSALPAGYRSEVTGSSNSIQSEAYFWGSTSVSAPYASAWNLRFIHEWCIKISGNKNNGFSLRCIKQ